MGLSTLKVGSIVMVSNVHLNNRHSYRMGNSAGNGKALSNNSKNNNSMRKSDHSMGHNTVVGPVQDVRAPN